jgi:hypothetical protein
MQFVSSGSNHSAHVKALIEQPQGLPLCALIRFLLTYEHFDLLGQKTTD